MASTTCHTPTWALTAPPTLTGHESTPPGADTIIRVTPLTTAPGDSTLVVTQGPGSHPPRLRTPPWLAPVSTAPRETRQVIQIQIPFCI